MIISQTSLIAISLILSITVLGVIALTRNTNTRLDLKLGKDKSLTIEGRRLPSGYAERSRLEQTEADCLPGEENSQLLKCDS
jgi:hypothetical protein